MKKVEGDTCPNPHKPNNTRVGREHEVDQERDETEGAWYKYEEAKLAPWSAEQIVDYRRGWLRVETATSLRLNMRAWPTNKYFLMFQYQTDAVGI